MSLDRIRDRLAGAAIVLDFDGTLAPIVPDPATAAPLPGAHAALAALAPRVLRLAIVTGRPAAFVRARLPVDGLEVVGLYGLEGATPVDPGVRAALADAVAAEPGAHLEDKGASLAVHVRRAADPEGAEARLRPVVAAIADGAGLVVREGKRVLELTPPGAGKGAAIPALCAGAAAALLAGDDLADAEAFRAAEDLGVPLLRVVVMGPETPDELVGVADVMVEGPEGLLDLLRSL
ncbi:MAG TPA: trehalose-phosphatase [Actinomycetota bacterium]|nr:trehalose-phosphatase [Actinomycetota bacterium]